MQSQQQLLLLKQIQDQWTQQREMDDHLKVANPTPTPVSIYLNPSEIERKVSPLTFVVINRAMGIVGWGYYQNSSAKIEYLCTHPNGAAVRSYLEWIEQQNYQLVSEVTSNKRLALQESSPFNSLTEYRLTKLTLIYLALTFFPSLQKPLELNPVKAKEILAYLSSRQIERFLPQLFLLFLEGREKHILRVYTPPKIPREGKVSPPSASLSPRRVEIKEVKGGDDYLLTVPYQEEHDWEETLIEGRLREVLTRHLPDPRVVTSLPPSYYQERLAAKAAYFYTYLNDYSQLMLTWEREWLKGASRQTPLLFSPGELSTIVEEIKKVTPSFEVWAGKVIASFSKYEGQSLQSYYLPGKTPFIQSIVDAISKAVIINGFTSTSAYDEKEYGNIFIPIELNAQARRTALRDEHRSDLEVVAKSLPQAKEYLYDNPERQKYGFATCPSKGECDQQIESGVVDHHCEMYAQLQTPEGFNLQ